METSRGKGYANPTTREFQFHLRQDRWSVMRLWS
jgi:hypothetical protein